MGRLDKERELIELMLHADPYHLKNYEKLLKSFSNADFDEFYKFELERLKQFRKGEEKEQTSFLRVFDAEREKFLLDAISKSNPSDHIYLGRKEDSFLMDLWETDGHSNVRIPSDLFWAKTIPLMDFECTVDDGVAEISTITNFRVIIFDAYTSLVDEVLKHGYGDVGAITVGCVVLKDDYGDACFVPICLLNGCDYLMFFSVGLFPGRNPGTQAQALNAMHLAFACMETWYGIQIALLHPAVKDVFSNPTIEAVHNQQNRKGKKRKTTYVKKHILTLENLETVSQSHEARKINRKCLAWYVIGHWRTYKDGKTVFIMPYWKGVLRDLKKNAENDERERSFDWTVSGKA